MYAIQWIAEFCFWLSATLILYTYLIYPVLIWLLSSVVSDRQPPEFRSADELPRVAILIAAHNEEGVISQRISNALALEYPHKMLRVVVASDGSSDRTVELARKFVDARVYVLDCAARRGKTATLCSAVRGLDDEIILLSDANTDFDPQAASKLVRWFSDHSVGVVCGKLLLVDPGTQQNADGLYWRYETFLKRCEGKLGALLGSNGAIYAIRRDIFPGIPDDTLVDDFVIPLAAKLKTGCRIVFEPEAIAREEVAPRISDEFRRRARIGAGGYQAIGLLWRLLHPRKGWIALSFFSHKLLRWFCPFFLIATLVCSLLLCDRMFYAVTAALQILLFIVAVPLSHTTGTHLPMRLLRLSSMFVLMNAALLAGFFRWLVGRQMGTWQPTNRIAKAGGT